MPDPKPPKENVERTGAQNLAAADSFGFAGAGIGIVPYGSAAGSFGGSGFGGLPNGLTLPVAALVGAGTFEGTNKYAGPILTPGGVAAYGLLPGAKKWAGTLGTYRIMSAHPTIVIAAMSILGPVLSAEWAVVVEKGVSSEAKEAVERFILPLRVRYVHECLRALTLGCASFEKVWEEQDGYLAYKKLKPLLPELHQPAVDEHGEYAGVVENGGMSINAGTVIDSEKIIKPTYAMTYAFGRIGSDFTGSPLMENVRRPWSNYLNTEDNLARLGAKVSSIIPIVKYPGGQDIDINGQKVPAFTVATMMAQGLASGRPVVAQNLAMAQLEDLRMVGELAKASLWDIDTVDMGETGGTVNALLAQLQYYDKLLVRGWCQPERSVLEAVSSGSRADSESHGDIGLSFCDMVHAEITDAANVGLVDDFVRHNFGEKLVGRIRLKAQPIMDDLKSVCRDIIKAMCTGKSLNDTLKRLDVDALFANVKLPREEGTDGPWNPTPEAPPALSGQPGQKPAQAKDDAMQKLSRWYPELAEEAL